MKPTMHRYRNEDDFWRIRAFLRELFMLNGQREVSWPVARLDYWRWHLVANDCVPYDSIDSVSFIWETPDGEIAAVLNPEGTGEAFLQVHPAFRTPELEGEMIDVAVEYLFAATPTGRKLSVWAHEQDTLRRDILADRGYTPGKWPEHQHRRRLAGDDVAAIPDVPVPEGYAVRSLGEVEELPARSWASWRAFHPDEPDENYEGWTWYHNIQRMPLYRRDLDIVAVGPAAEIASFCTVWYDDVTRSAYFEPVGTVPEHQQRGLAKAVMCEGLRRLQRMGATLAFVSGYSTAANALYTSVAGGDYELNEPWEKGW